ncbi:UNVERIFIED_CONTAM: hypothetical protein GTU68_020491 [Idotea baltica]|nr:hypothetical protein [Idotea baltica]
MIKCVRLFFITLCLGLITACGNEPDIKQAKFYAFGTEIDISLYGVSVESANGTLSALEQTFSEVDATWHAWRPSTLTQINQAIAERKTITVTDEVAELILFAKSLAQASEHLFNPAAGRLFELWGFQEDNWFNSHPPPSQDRIDDWLRTEANMNAITITDNVLKSDNPAVQLGFGGFAKGFAVDQAILALQRHGIDNALVNIGGDLRVIGQPGERPWVVGIRHPRQDGMLATIAISGDESVFTSGDYERFFEYQGQRYAHIMDSRTGWPADHAISVTVLHDNATIADAAATALFVAGQDWPRIATSMNIKHVMLVRPDGVIEMSPDMLERVALIDNNAPTIVRSPNLP